MLVKGAPGNNGMVSPIHHDSSMQIWRQAIVLTNDDKIHDDVIKWKHFGVTYPLCGEFAGHRWIPRTKASDAEFWRFLWSAPE